MAVTSATNAPAAADTYESQAQARIPQQALTQGDFLKLLVAQLSAQDPMNPVSNTDFAAQMAQYSTLQQTQAMQTSMAGMQSGQAGMQASSLLGRTVEVQADDSTTDTGVVSAVGFEAGTPTLIVNDKPYSLSQVLAVSLTQPQS